MKTQFLDLCEPFGQAWSMGLLTMSFCSPGFALDAEVKTVTRICRDVCIILVQYRQKLQDSSLEEVFTMQCWYWKLTSFEG